MLNSPSPLVSARVEGNAIKEGLTIPATPSQKVIVSGLLSQSASLAQINNKN